MIRSQFGALVNTTSELNDASRIFASIEMRAACDRDVTELARVSFRIVVDALEACADYAEQGDPIGLDDALGLALRGLRAAQALLHSVVGLADGDIAALACEATLAPKAWLDLSNVWTVA